MPKLTIKEAAEQLGISEVSVRRRLKKGDLHGERMATAQGYTWLVVLADAEETVTPHQNGQNEATDHLLVEELRGQDDYLKHELAERRREHDRDRDDWREDLHRVHTLMAQQGQTIQALTQRVEQLPAQVRVDEHAGDTAEDASAPWWRRWWRSVTGEV